ncbi:hypothetical protein F2P44_01790 [Massilia sp. CCM 8695]|uniref:HTH psq-type domain-containing protein n=1 Tax=Massilia frigida TaxID=2609281 RepID=A0ABX0MYH5_9BURK|nr:hypothetical protein [Massilia frigida]NHZ78031.1 hypothetical protein [Massilia frigida]
MLINEISTIGEALWVLSALTGRRWSESEFISEVLRLRLPVYARAPNGASIVSRIRVDGRLVETPEPNLPANLVTLLQYEIEELVFSPGPQIIAYHPAWVYGDEPYEPWDKIKAFRAANHRVLAYWEVERGEWMGDSDRYFFARPVQVTSHSTFVVPRFVIAEIIEAHRSRIAEAVAVSVEPEVCHPVPTAAKPPAVESTVVVQRSMVAPKQAKGKTWDTHALRRLYEESLLPGATHPKLAEEYSVSRQFISKQIHKAKDQFGLRKADPFSALRPAASKK